MSQTTDRRSYTDPSVSVQHDSNNNVTFTIWTDIVAGEGIEIALSPDRAATLLRDLANQVTYALTRAAASIAAGDCPRCLNIRMIDEEVRPGRTERVHCPECAPNGMPTFPQRPQIGGGLS